MRPDSDLDGRSNTVRILVVLKTEGAIGVGSDITDPVQELSSAIGQDFGWSVVLNPSEQHRFRIHLRLRSIRGR